MNIQPFLTGVTQNITNQTAPRSIPATIVGGTFSDLADLTKVNVEAVETALAIVQNSYLNKTSDVKVYSKNLFDKTRSYVVTGKGIGTDGNIFDFASAGMVQGLPVDASTQYVISGANALRGLRFEKDDGTRVTPDTYIGTISNGTAFTTPTGTTRISFQLWLGSNTGATSTLQVEKGSFQTAYEPYKGFIRSISGSEIKNYDKEIYAKSEVDGLISPLQVQVTNNADRLNNITSKKSYTAQITPSPTYNYIPFTITEMGEQRSWYFAKSVKTIRSVGVFIFKHTANGTIAQNIRVQVLHKRGSVITVLANKTILPADLTKFNTTGIIGGYANYEQKVDFNTSITLAIGDVIFTSIQSKDKLYPIYGTENAQASTGEWNADGINCYRGWNPTNNTSIETIFADIPTLPSPEVNYDALHFYNYTESPFDIQSRIDELSGKTVNVGTVSITGKNKFNKDTMYVNNSGIGTDFVIFSAAGFGRTDAVPVKENTTYVISGGGALRGLRFENSGGTLISGIANPSNGAPFTTPSGTTRFRVQILTGATNTLQVEEGSSATTYEAYKQTVYVQTINGNALLGSDNSDSGSTVPSDYDVIIPKPLYSGFNDLSGNRTESSHVWVQKFIREKKNLFLNDKLNSVLINKFSNTGNLDNDTLSFTLSGTDFITKSLSIQRISTKYSVLASSFPKVLYIGDSITENRPKNGVYEGAGAMWSYPKEIAQKNRVDNGNTGFDYLCIGNLHGINNNITYKGQSVNIKGFANGRGGWTAFGFLRHPFRMWVGSKQGAWDLLGLTTSLGRNYVSSQTDNKIIATTNYGVNTPIVSANSYDLLVFENQIANLGAWTGSGTQIAAVQNWITAVANGTATQNEFFDINKTGTTRFSVAKYLAQYKTLANDGVTRLVTGSTAGSKVTNPNAFDVCEPSHIIIGLPENDRLFYNDYVQISNDLLEFASIIHNEYSNIHVGIALTAIPGDMFPERNPDYSGLFYQNHHNAKYDLYKELTSRFGDYATQKTNKTYLLPTWFTGTPLSNSFTRDLFATDQPNKTYQIGNDDYNHPGYWHNISAGVTVYNWVASTAV